MLKENIVVKENCDVWFILFLILAVLFLFATSGAGIMCSLNPKKCKIGKTYKIDNSLDEYIIYKSFFFSTYPDKEKFKNYNMTRRTKLKINIECDLGQYLLDNGIENKYELEKINETLTVDSKLFDGTFNSAEDSNIEKLKSLYFDNNIINKKISGTSDEPSVIKLSVNINHGDVTTRLINSDELKNI